MNPVAPVLPIHPLNTGGIGVSGFDEAFSGDDQELTPHFAPIAISHGGVPPTF
ncbi:hypothetical protein ABH944_004004 [Caballeronia udeis]|jgi:hypothetical protein|uniref:Uncharacterized protein n=1 Tax=Caballeronia udeis TaxID=1232866 RepID=A0ABW8MLJ1_9BURK